MKNRLKGFLKKAGYSLRTADHITCILMALVVCVGVFSFTAGASTEVNTNIGGIDMTISRFSEIMAGTFSDNIAQSINHKGATMEFMQAVDKDDTDGSSIKKNQFSLGTVGNVLGYPGEREDTSNASNIWTDGSDASSKMLTLESLWDLHAGDRNSSSNEVVEEIKTSPIAQYIVFGSALNYMGVDEFRDAKAAPDGMRMIIGYSAYVFFILAYSANNIMGEVVKLVSKMNVFMWIWNGLKGGVEVFFKDILGVDNLRDVVLIDEIMAALEQVMRLRWVILGLMVVLFVMSLTVFKTAGHTRAAQAQTRGRRLVYRLIIMCIGVPICGMIFTECIDVIGKFTEDTNGDITKYVFQEFMDFEAWTTGQTDGNKMLRSFRVGSDLSDTYRNINITYESSGQRFIIKDKDGDAIDVSRFVYAANESSYGTDITGKSSKIDYVSSLFGDPEGGGTVGSYSDIINSEVPEGAKRDTTEYKSEAYKRCRDLLLNYARSNTVMPDKLNNYYLSDMNDVAGALVQVSAGASDETAANQAAAANATVMEQLFGVNASEQRIWSFIELNGNWIYPATDSSKNLMLLESKVNGSTEKIELKLRGLAASSCDKGDNRNGVTIVHGGTETPIMVSTLCNLSAPGIGGNRISCVASESKAAIESNTSGSKGNVNNYTYTYRYNLVNGGMSPLSLYNYMHSKFENGTLTVYSPKLTTNAGVGTMHYAVTTPYSGIPELVQLLFTISILFSLGIIGWVFGISLLVNSIVQMVKSLPVMLKMMVGSIQGLAEGLLIVFSVVLEMLVTIALYTLSVHIIDFLIRMIRGVCLFILKAFGTATGGTMEYIDPETYSIIAGLLSTAVILWGTFNLLKWRVAITLSLKSIVTKMINSLLGTNAAMPTGADSKMLKAAAGLAAGGMIAGALAQDGTLDDVVNDLTQSDLGTSMHDKISEGDWDGAMEDLKSYADGTYVSGDGDVDRGVNAEDEAQKMFGDGADSLDGSFSMQSLTDDQQQELDDKYKDDALAAADKLDEARKSGDQDAIDEAQSEFDDIMQARAADAAAMRAENGEKARELGVPDYGDYLRSQKGAAEAQGIQPIEGADIPDEPEKELTSDAQMAYDAARDGDAETLRSSAGIYDANGLTAEQADKIDEMIADGASEAEIAEAVEGFAEENFGENHAAVVDKINEAAGRSGGALYGSTDNSDGNARTVAVASGHAEDGSRAYGVRDNSSDEGPKTFTTGSNGELQQKFDSELPSDPGQRLSAENQAVYDAAVNGDQDALAEAAETLDENGLTEAQAAHIDDMVESGASAADIAAQVDEYANSNLGANHKAVMERVNAAAGRDNTAEYGKGLEGSSRSVAVRAKDGSMSGEGSDWGVTDGTVASVGHGSAFESTFQADGKGGMAELPSAISDAPSKDLTAANQAIFEAARDGDTAALQQAAGQVNEHGLTMAQQQAVTSMVASGASEAEVAAAIDNFAQDNFGNDYKQVVDSINDAAGRGSTATYSAATGGGADGSEPRAMSVEAGYADGMPSYAVDDLGTEEGAHMVQVSDENGQSVYKDTMPSAGGEQIVTSDFGQFNGQTYGSIRNEVDAVANASGGMLQRGSGAGDFGKTTVSEAASEIAARQSRTQSGGKAKAVVGSSGLGAEGADISAFNKAADKAAENTGLERGSVAGISGTVDKQTGMAVNALPTAETMQPVMGKDGQPMIGLDGKPVMQGSGTNGTTAQLLSAQSVDSYGRSQAAAANDLGVTVAPMQSAQQGSISGVPAGEPSIKSASSIPAVSASGQPDGMPAFYDANGNAVTATVGDNGAMTFTSKSGASVSPASVYSSTAASDGLTMYTQGDAQVTGSVNRDGSMTLTGSDGKKVPAGEVIQAAQGDGIQFHDANGQSVQAVANRNGTMGFVDAQGRSISANQVFASAPVDHNAAAQDAMLSAIPTTGTGVPSGNVQPVGGTEIPGAISPAYAPVNGGPAIPTAPSGPVEIQGADSIPITGSGQAVQYDKSGSVVTPSVSNGVTTYTNESGQTVDPGSVYSSIPVSSGGAQLYTAQDAPVSVVPNTDGTVSFKSQSGQPVPAGEVIQAAQGDGVAFHTSGGQFVNAVDNGNGTVSFIDSQGTVVPASDVQVSAPADHGAAAQTATAGGFTKADIPMALGAAAAAMTFVKTGNLGSAAMAYTGTKNAAGDIVNRVAGTEAPQTAGTVQNVQRPSGPVQASAPASYNVPGTRAVNTAAVPTVTGGTLNVARCGDGVIRTVDESGNVTAQAVAMTSNGQYQTITQAKDGSYRTSGTGETVVRTTDGSFVVTTKDSSGNLTMADSTGGSSGTILTRTSDGYQPAVASPNGTVYSVNENGQATGSVVVKSVDGSGVSVVRHADKSIRMADANGGASDVVMAALAGGVYAPIGNTGRVSTTSGTSVQVVTLNDGTKAGVVQDSGGNWFMADGAGKPSSTPIIRDASGNWSAGTYSGSEVRETTTSTTIIREGTEQTPVTPPSQAWAAQFGETFWKGAPTTWPQNLATMNTMQSLQFMEYLQSQGIKPPQGGPSGTDGQPTTYQPIILNPEATPEGDEPGWSANGGNWIGDENRG